MTDERDEAVEPTATGAPGEAGEAAEAAEAGGDATGAASTSPRLRRTPARGCVDVAVGDG